MKGGGNSIRVDGRYTAAYGPHEVKLNLDGINICTKAMIASDVDPMGQIYVGREELKVRSIGRRAMLEETKEDVSAHVLEINKKRLR